MVDRLKELLQDEELQKKLAGAASHDETVKLIVAAGGKKGYTLTAESVGKMLAKLMAPASRELSEEELHNVAGGMMSSGRMSMNNDCGSNYGPSCPTKYMCSTNLCTKWSGCR